MKISAFHLMPHRELPADFEKRYESVWVTPPWWELADPAPRGPVLQLDARRAAPRRAVRVRRHLHQRASPERLRLHAQPQPHGRRARQAHQRPARRHRADGRRPSPRTNPPIRVAEEYGMLDCISGGRLVAGLPLGSPMDVNLCYGITPMEQRERYREAFALIIKAWQAREIFAWNGKYYQLANVNLWPRPIQKPHPPVWVPGSGSVSTFDFAVEQRRLLLLPELLRGQVGQGAHGRLLGRGDATRDASRIRTAPGSSSWSRSRRRTPRPRREYARHVEYFYHKCLHVPAPWFSPAGQPGLPEPRWPPPAIRCGPGIPRISATATSWSAATSSPGARRPSASASRRKW